ncbi:MAG: class I SAM-dependent methyltransferase [Myxococcota bacterium]|nr:class I SAM-dependent methyltransferase [Myxococcota bacterium]
METQILELCADGFEQYEVLDSGDGLKLERLGDVIISRQCAQAVWTRSLDESVWTSKLWASHYRTDNGPGKWTYRQSVADAWPIQLGKMRLEMRLTDFGHIGMFAEQQAQWSWIQQQCEALDGARVLNLFAYTGGSTLAAALGGAQVTHLDAVKGVVNWASANARWSGLEDHPIRWIVDDALKFTARELRRGRKYDAVILDPPTFGRGPKGDVWKIESSLTELLDNCFHLLSDTPIFVLLSAHTPGFTASVLRNVLKPSVSRAGGTLVSGDMVQATGQSDIVLPAGVFCRWLP